MMFDYDLAEIVFGIIGTFGLFMLLVPQIWENYRNSSTQGLSMGLILLWHVSSILCLAFYLVEWEPCEALGMLAVCITSSVIEGQHVGYRRWSKRAEVNQTGHPWHIIGAVFAAGVVATSAAVTLLVLLLLAEPQLGAPVSAVASILLGVGFLPQYYEFLCTWSTQGYSFGVTAFDLMGCGANCLAAWASAHGKFDFRLIAIMAPFLIIIVCHFGLIALAAVIAMTKPSLKAEGRFISVEDGLGVQPDAATKSTPLLSQSCKSEK